MQTAKNIQRLSVGLFFAINAQFSRYSFAFKTEPTSFLSELEPLADAQFAVTPGDGHADLIKAFDLAKKSINVGISNQVQNGSL